VSEAAALARGREELGAARALLAAGFPSQALSRACLAGFHAASAALQSLGELPATSTGVVSAFGKRVVSEGGFDHGTGRELRRLLEDRNDVDYALAEAPPEVAERAIDAATELVSATESWLAEQK
jgi:uncharacterized protein (UPF0332 family)